MTKIYLMTAAAALALGLSAGSVSAAPKAHNAQAKAAGQLASPAQLKREHDRAVKAGDHANDPFNSASSDELNRQQLAKAQMLGTEPGVPDVAQSQNTALNGQDAAGLKTTDTSAVDAASVGSTTETSALPEAAVTPPAGNGSATMQNPIAVPETTDSADKTNPTDGPSLKKQGDLPVAQ